MNEVVMASYNNFRIYLEGHGRNKDSHLFKMFQKMFCYSFVKFSMFL